MWMFFVAQHGDPEVLRHGETTRIKYVLYLFSKSINIQGEIIYAPPPHPISGHKAFFRGGGGGVYFEAPRGRNFIRPPFLYTPQP